MRLDAGTSAPGRLVFAFDGGTNFDPAKDTHVHSGVVEWKGDSLHNVWTVYSGGKETGRNEFVLTRAPGQATPTSPKPASDPR
jgi:hypothetical protein